MSSTVRIMYKTGVIFNFVIFALSIIFVLAGILTIAFAKDIASYALEKGFSAFDNPNEVKILGRTVVIIAGIVFVQSVTTLVLAIYSKNKIEFTNVGNTTPYVILLVIGIFGNPFYLMSGVFGLVELQNINRNYGSM